MAQISVVPPSGTALGKSENIEDNMKSMGILDDNERISEMLEAGEPTTIAGGENNFHIDNA